MDETALKSLIVSLQTHRDALDFWLNIFSGMVAVGVIAEIAFVIREHAESMGAWRRGIIRPPDRPSPLWFLLELLGVALVSIGVAGEFFVDVRAGSLETQIRRANGDLILFLEQKVNDAETSAHNAAGESQQAKDDAGDAHKEAGSVARQAAALGKEMQTASFKLRDLNLRAGWANQDALRFTREISALDSSLEAERTKELEMEKALSPRILPLIVGPPINSSPLQPFSGLRVIIEIVPDGEARRAAEEIRTFVKSAGWMSADSDLSPNEKLFAGFFDGVIIEPYDPYLDEKGNRLKPTEEQMAAGARSSSAANALIGCLHDAGWNARTVSGAALGLVPENAIKVMIGMKPSSFNPLYEHRPD
jgi:hypothetical protein